jgi:hypothetical protein
MLRGRDKRMLARFWPFFSGLVLFLLVLLEYVFNLNEAVTAWTTFIALVVVGAEALASVLKPPRGQPINRWYGAAHWATWIMCMVGGTLVIGAVIAWLATRLSLPRFADIVSPLLLAAGMVGLVGFFVAGGLAVTGAQVKHRQETRRSER